MSSDSLCPPQITSTLRYARCVFLLLAWDLPWCPGSSQFKRVSTAQKWKEQKSSNIIWVGSQSRHTPALHPQAAILGGICLLLKRYQWNQARTTQELPVNTALYWFSLLLVSLPKLPHNCFLCVPIKYTICSQSLLRLFRLTKMKNKTKQTKTGWIDVLYFELQLDNPPNNF